MLILIHSHEECRPVPKFGRGQYYGYFLIVIFKKSTVAFYTKSGKGAKIMVTFIAIFKISTETPIKLEAHPSPVPFMRSVAPHPNSEGYSKINRSTSHPSPNP